MSGFTVNAEHRMGRVWFESGAESEVVPVVLAPGWVHLLGKDQTSHPACRVRRVEWIDE